MSSLSSSSSKKVVVKREESSSLSTTPNTTPKQKWPPFNPFVRHPTSDLGKLKMMVLGPILVPIRLGGAIATLSVALLWCYICSWNCDTSQPYSPLRRWFLLGGIGILARILLFFYGFVYITESFEEEPSSSSQQPEAPIVLVNHLGFAELLFLIQSYHCCFVSKDTNRALPFIGTITEVMQSIFVHRGEMASSGASSVKKESTTAKLQQRARAPPGTWPPLCICPEGTTHTGHVLLNFATGAFRPGLPVQPVCVTMKFDPTHGYDPSFSCANIVTHVLGLMTQPYNQLHVHHLKVHVPTEAERKDPVLYASVVRHKMAKALQVPMYDLNWLDKLQYEPNPKSQALGRQKMKERYGSNNIPPPPTFTQDVFGNSLVSEKDKDTTTTKKEQ